MVITDKSIWVFIELFLQAFYRLGDLLNARIRGMAPELMVHLLMRRTENSHSVFDANVPWKVFPASCTQGAARLRSAVAGEWGQVHVTGCVTVWTGKSRLLPDGDTIMGCSDIPVGVHARTPPTPSWGHREAPNISHHACGMSQLGRVAWDPHTSLWDPHLTPPRAALPHSSRSKASVHKSPKHFASLHSVGNYHILSANCVPPNNLTRQVRLLLLMLFQLLSCVQFFCDPMDCNSPGFSVYEILQARILEWVAVSFYKGSSRPSDRTLVSCVSCTGR